ncbi:hypothetical protein GMOD_00001179 [Pyrenophora seminiperda CCB06]|uniref:Uncharacterized protein n=1 Tax=Pyrenophora seminiperda CCB06 TaxID=1302712 RepID=A0A3M7LYF4_9PLEO|nr:hypothetical protein GMOD_00001179 [Pyrenophora seminiperda CCB06]
MHPIYVNRDRCSISFVTADFRAMIAQDLWRSLSRLPERQMMDPAGNFIRYTTELTIWDSDGNIENRDRFMRFVMTLKDNQLKSLSANKGMTIDMLCTVLHKHREIHTLRVPLVETSDDDSLDTQPWIGPYFKNLKSLEVHLGAGRLEHDIPNYRFMIQHAPDLESLQIMGHWYAVEEGAQEQDTSNVILEDGSLFLDGILVLQKLEHLSVNCIDFDNTGNANQRRLLPDTVFSQLKSLRLRNCSNVRFFLEELLEHFEEHGAALEILEIANVTIHGIDDAIILNDFLQSFTGLKELCIDFNTWVQGDNGAGAARSIISHSETLETLCTGVGHTLNRGHDIWLKRILDGCLNLKQLGLLVQLDDRPPVQIHRKRKLDDLAVGATQQPIAYSILDLLAEYPNIRTLRMLDKVSTFRDEDIRDPPNIATRQLMTNAAAAWTQQWANRVIEHLKSRGSNIEVFAMSRYQIRDLPSNDFRNQALFVDDDGQRYPRYTYDVDVDYEHHAELVLEPGATQPPPRYKGVPIKDVKKTRPWERVLFYQYEVWSLVNWENCNTLQVLN